MQKQFSKILTSFFLLVFIFQLAGLIFLLAVPEPSQAEEKKVYFVPQVGIGDDFQKGNKKLVGDSTAMIGEYIKAIYKYAIGIVGILAAVVLMFGGIKWLVAGGNAERIGDAKSWIGAALTGLVITLASYTILYTVNPDLVNFKITTIDNVEKPTTITGGCCPKDSTGVWLDAKKEDCDFWIEDGVKSTINGVVKCVPCLKYTEDSWCYNGSGAENSCALCCYGSTNDNVDNEWVCKSAP